MTRDLLFSPGSLLLGLVLGASALGQSGPPPAAPSNSNGQGQPVSYASVTQLNGLLGQVEATSQKTQSDLVTLRIEHWRADTSYKRQALGNVDSIQRNLQGALPEIIAQLRSSPENLPATFKLYRNLDALYDVLGSVTEGAGAFGSKDDLQSLSNDLSSFERTRKQLADRIDTLSAAKEAEIARLRTDLKNAQVEAPLPPKKIVVDDTEPPKKPAPKKKTTPKKPATEKPATDSKKPAAAPQSAPPQQNPTKPQ
jgi:multidrug efflux pump subunit AcrA (membrane-fusion protein)